MKIEAMTGVEPELGRLEKLYVQHGPVALATAFLLLGDRAQAEDAVQEAFLRLLGRFRHVRTPEAFDSYLRRTVVNLCLNQLRRRRVERAYFERERRHPGVADASLPDVGLREQLWKMLQGLPARQRAAIVLRFYEDLSEQQVADILACSVPAARSLVFRGMEALRQHIQSEEP